MGQTRTETMLLKLPIEERKRNLGRLSQNNHRLRTLLSPPVREWMWGIDDPDPDLVSARFVVAEVLERLGLDRPYLTKHAADGDA